MLKKFWRWVTGAEEQTRLELMHALWEREAELMRQQRYITPEQEVRFRPQPVIRAPRVVQTPSRPSALGRIDFSAVADNVVQWMPAPDPSPSYSSPSCSSYGSSSENSSYSGSCDSGGGDGGGGGGD